MSGKEFRFAVGFGDTVREREFEVLGKELFNVGTLDIVVLLELDDLKNLDGCFFSMLDRRLAPKGQHT